MLNIHLIYTYLPNKTMQNWNDAYYCLAYTIHILFNYKYQNLELNINMLFILLLYRFIL